MRPSLLNPFDRRCCRVFQRTAWPRALSLAVWLSFYGCTSEINPTPSSALNAGVHPSSATMPCSDRFSPVSSPLPIATGAGSEPNGPVRHALVITIDGLLPETYVQPELHGLRIPTLRRLRNEGASSDGAMSVWPSLTYPAHTSIASGALPARHGIMSNGAFDPLGTNQDGWRWYASDVKVPRVWDVARAAGYRTALIDWPVTVGSEATLHVPEFWRARVDEDLKLISALSTPKDILQRVAAEYPAFGAGFHPQDVSDAAGVDIASYALEHVKPHVLFLHIWEVDHAQHVYGLWSNEALAAIENADLQLGRLLDVVKRTGLATDTAFVVTSDHGFTNIHDTFHPRALLQDAGLLTLDDDGRVSDWRATVLPTHGTAYVYLKDPSDAAAQQATLHVFQEAAREHPDAIARILDAQQIAAVGGDPAAFLALTAPLGVSFGTGYESWSGRPVLKATHGYDPAEPAMRASLLLYGAGVKPGRLTDARLIDIAPTVASWLGLAMPSAEGHVLTVQP